MLAMEQGRSVHWERLAIVRSPLMVLAGLACLCVAAFMWAVPAGWAAVGMALLLLAYLTESGGGNG